MSVKNKDIVNNISYKNLDIKIHIKIDIIIPYCIVKIKLLQTEIIV
jgi:hypothetical protein